MLQKMYKKMNKKGFTLMEMLIVVAIIAILIAIAIPTFTSSIEKAKKATDDANFRTLKAIITAAYLSGDLTIEEGETVYCYLKNDGESYTTDPTEAIDAKTGDGKIGYKVYIDSSTNSLKFEENRDPTGGPTEGTTEGTTK